jgi:EPS-associated MarR family transcriptional regulator
MDDSTSYKIYRLIHDNPEISQRELARILGISLGKANYCLQGLIGKGLIKASRFYNKNKSVYLYLLTPKGIEDNDWTPCGEVKLNPEKQKDVSKKQAA